MPVPSAVEVGDQEERYWPFGSREDLMDMRMSSWEVDWEREGGRRERRRGRRERRFMFGLEEKWGVRE